MTQYNTLNLKLSNSQLNKLKLGIKNGTEVTLNLSTQIIINQHTSFEVSWSLCVSFIRQYIKLSKTQLLKIVQSGGFLVRIPQPLFKTGLPLMKSVLKRLA